ncbi:helix-turn-helix transcriptional regulator [Filimonas lacunae]|nr:helix-turn-helix transcriptional regulator [Filimonas lacunae]BAV04759.1 hypothetical protein FLA_0758 [Filimonas lacunae]
MNRIKAVIAEHKSTGKALAEYLEYHPNSVSQWSVNSAQPSLYDLYKIATFFNINVQDLIIPTIVKPGASPCDIAKITAQEAKKAALIQKKAAKKQKNKSGKQP